MITGKTRSGWEFSVSKEVFDDMELVDELAEMDNNPVMVSKVLNRILEPEKKASLYNHLREDGRVKLSKVVEELQDIFGAFGQTGKNS